jgi:spore maturation protein SpmB
MPITALEKLSVATAVGMTLSLLTTGAANAYTFTKIADTNGPLGKSLTLALRSTTRAP